MIKEADISIIPGPVLVGVVNVTPDSFSDGGQFLDPGRAVEHIEQLAAQGAAVIDIGGESTRPGSVPVDAEAEWERIGPVVRACSGRFTLSIDTQKSLIAKRALDLGAGIINDVSALRFDPDIAAAVARHDAYLVLMYSAFSEIRPPRAAPPRRYGDVTAEIASFLRERISLACDSGVNPKKIIVDPGLGAFVSSDPSYSWEVLAGLGRLPELGVTVPIMIGASRKGFLGAGFLGGTPLGRSPASRDPLSQLAALLAVRNGARFIRTHNVEMARSVFDNL